MNKEVAKNPEQERFERITAKIASLDENDQRQIQAGIAMIEMMLAQMGESYGILAVAYVSCRIAAGIEATEPEQPRLVVPGRIVN